MVGRRLHLVHDPELDPLAGRQAHRRRAGAADPAADGRRHRRRRGRGLAEGARRDGAHQRQAGEDRGRQGPQAAQVRVGSRPDSPTWSSWRRASGRTSTGSKDSGVDIKQGIVVDEHLRSSVPNVYAAGDVAQGRDLISGQSGRARHRADGPGARPDRRREHGGQGRAVPRLAHHQHRGGLSPGRRLVRRLGRRARPKRSAASRKTAARTASCCSRASGSPAPSSSAAPTTSGRPTTSAC